METVRYEGKTYNVFTVNSEFGNYRVICVPTRYRNDTLAIELLTVDPDEYFERFCVLTVNLCNPMFQSEKTAFVDTNNNAFAEKFIKKNKLGKDLYQTCSSGYCTYPLYEFYTEKFFAE